MKTDGTIYVDCVSYIKYFIIIKLIFYY